MRSFKMDRSNISSKLIKMILIDDILSGDYIIHWKDI